jgi:hypothetical protein
MTNNSIFLPPSKTEWAGYANIRDTHYVKDFLGSLTRFKKEMQTSKEKFNQRAWELCLIQQLLDSGHSLIEKHKTDGPDICLIIENRKVWIELICPDIGIDKHNSVPRIDYRETSDINVKTASWTNAEADRQIKLRYTGAIAEKYKATEKYFLKNLIMPEDYVIIAINSANLDRETEELDELPNAIKICYGQGNSVINVEKNPKTNKTKFTDSYENEIHIEKKSLISSINIETCIFLKNTYPRLNGLLFSYHGFAAYSHNAQKNFHFGYNNAFCATSFAEGFLKSPTIEYSLKDIHKDKDGNVGEALLVVKKFNM